MSLDAEDNGDLAAHAVALYAEQGFSAREVAEQLGVSRPKVTIWLKAAGIELGPRGRGRPRPNRRLSDPDDLGEVLQTLYVDQRLDVKAIGAALGMSERTVRSRLEEHGIPRRSKGGFDRRDRLDPDSKVIEELYVRLGMTANQVAAQMGTSRKTVLRSAHEHGLPVRQPPSVSADVPGRTRLVYDLYRDPLVIEVLGRHRVPVIPPVGPIWVRFPEPVPLGEQLARDLYEGCGVGLAHIELLTGHPIASVRRRFRQWQIPVRKPGGRCPFLHRLGTPGGPGFYAALASTVLGGVAQPGKVKPK